MPGHGHGEYKMPGGKLCVADIELEDGVLHQASISGDFFMEPDSLLDSINTALSGLALPADAARIERVIAAALPADAQLYGTSPAAIAAAVQRALLDGANP